MVVNTQSVDVAEIVAAVAALLQAAKEGVEKLEIKTCSGYLMDCIKNITKWKKNGWRNSRKNPVANYEQLSMLKEVMEESSVKVKWTWVKSSCNGIIKAGKLAKANM